MAIIINIETATKNCSVSIAKNGQTISITELNNGTYSHAEKLHIFIEDVLEKTNISINKVDAIAVSKGPGSYTGLRIGVSTAKGLCFALNKPLIAIDTLKVLANSIKINHGIIVPMLDARRMEVYCAVYDNNYQQTKPIQAKIIDETSFIEELNLQKVYFVGDGTTKCKTVIKHANANFIENIFPSAEKMSALSFNKFTHKEFEDVAYFEPFYLKDFLVTPQKNK